MSDLYIETDKGRLFIIGDGAKEIFVPPGCTIHVYEMPDITPTINIPPINCEMDEETAKEITEMIVKNIRNRMAILEQAEKGY